jgi:hypothetical protein
MTRRTRDPKDGSDSPPPPQEDPKGEPKEDPKDDPKGDPNDDPKGEPSDDPKDDPTDEPKDPSAPTAAIRTVLLPLSRFYTRAQTPTRDQLPPELTEEERAVLRDAGEKFVAEAQGILRTWRTEGDACPPTPPERDPKTGRYPEPTLCFVSELLVATGMAAPDPELASQRQALELARLEAEVERERLAAERARFEWMTAQLRAGNTKVVDPGPVERSQPVLLRAASAPAPAETRPMAMTAEPTASWSTRSRSVVRSGQARSTSAALTAAPETSTPSSERTLRQRLLDCIRIAFCDFLMCVLDLFCADGSFDFLAFRDPEKVARLIDCFGVFLCTAMRCFVDALCPPEPPTCAPPQLDCNFAVEGVN